MNQEPDTTLIGEINYWVNLKMAAKKTIVLTSAGFSNKSFWRLWLVPLNML